MRTEYVWALNVPQQKRWALSAAALALGATLSGGAFGQAGTEQYQYDALGRLTKVTRTNGQASIYEYDAAGNRSKVAPGASGPPGTITLVSAKYPSGCPACTGEFWIDVRNSGTGVLSSASFALANVGVAGCSPNAWTGSIAVGQTVRLTWYKASSASVRCGPRVTASNASNSPAFWDI